MRVIGDFLFDNEMLVYIVVYDKTSYAISEKLFSDVTSYIDDAYIDESPLLTPMPMQTSMLGNAPVERSNRKRTAQRQELEDVEFGCSRAH